MYGNRAVIENTWSKIHQIHTTRSTFHICYELVEKDKGEDPSGSSNVNTMINACSGINIFESTSDASVSVVSEEKQLNEGI